MGSLPSSEHPHCAERGSESGQKPAAWGALGKYGKQDLSALEGGDREASRILLNGRQCNSQGTRAQDPGELSPWLPLWSRDFLFQLSS